MQTTSLNKKKKKRKKDGNHVIVTTQVKYSLSDKKEKRKKYVHAHIHTRGEFIYQKWVLVYRQISIQMKIFFQQI